MPVTWSWPSSSIAKPPIRLPGRKKPTRSIAWPAYPRIRGPHSDKPVRLAANRRPDCGQPAYSLWASKPDRFDPAVFFPSSKPGADGLEPHGAGGDNDFAATVAMERLGLPPSSRLRKGWPASLCAGNQPAAALDVRHRVARRSAHSRPDDRPAGLPLRSHRLSQ